MKHLNRVLMTSLAVLFFACLATAQQKPEQKAQQIIPLKVQVVLSEYAGQKKISSLPYTLDVNAVTSGNLQWTRLRLGVRFPIQTGHDQIEYVDLGTNIDCGATVLPDGAYKLDISTARSSIYVPTGKKATVGPMSSSDTPIIRNFHVSNKLILRDGQRDESTVATDPVSGHVLRISVTLHVVKSAS